MLAYDGSGGEYHLLADGRVLLLGGEGEVGIVGRDFQEFLAIAVGLSSWHSALRFIRTDDMAQARGEWQAYEQQWGLSASLDQPWPFSPGSYRTATPREARALIADHFLLPDMENPFAALFSTPRALSTDVIVTFKGEKVRLICLTSAPMGQIRPIA